QAIEGTYIDKKCPFTGNVSIRGRILSEGMGCEGTRGRGRGDCVGRLERRAPRRGAGHRPPLAGCVHRDVQIGDIVTVGECRPLSKTVRFNVLKVTKAAGTKKQFQKF
ncbi:RS11 protein, partial [Todus mexicanus]|nr:RS11 protein [Todus mexicanus]